MEMENVQQKVNPEGNLNQDTPPYNPISNQRGNFLLIIGVVVLLLVIGVGGYFLYQKQATKPVIIPQQIPQTTTSPNSMTDETTNWKTYKNTKHGYSVIFPSILEVTNSDGKTINVENSNSVIFDYPNPTFGIPPYYISVMSEPSGATRDFEIYNSLSQPTLDKIFSLKLGEELDKKTTQDIGGGWEFPTNYKRLPDETVNSLKFIVLENPKWYGGSNRILFLKKDGNIYMTGITYQKDEQLKEFQQFYSSLKFSN